ncbi:MAG: ATP synthase F0 subunit C [Acidobacteriia bacterium]|nr:ATP synthase F0 subunit C [Terriglobia bacterium]
MTKKLIWLTILFLLASPLIFAQTPAAANAPSESHLQWVVISAGFSMAIGSGLCGLGQGKAVAAAAEAIARNPGAAAKIQLAMLIGLAFIESLAIYVLLIVFLKVA